MKLESTLESEPWNVMDPLQYLLTLEKFGIKFGLANIQTLTDALGRPQDAFKSILVAGTNGKGSVTAMVDCALGKTGLRVGRYTSPHLVRLEERFTIDGAPVRTEVLAGMIEEIRTLIDDLIARGSLEAPPTFFEVTTAIAFELFKRAGVAIAVLEVGLGGRLDSTNIVQPIAAAITSIDFDHEQYLGYTLAAIAAEKAGVIRRDIPVVVGPVPTERATYSCRCATSQVPSSSRRTPTAGSTRKSRRPNDRPPGHPGRDYGWATGPARRSSDATRWSRSVCSKSWDGSSRCQPNRSPPASVTSDGPGGCRWLRFRAGVASCSMPRIIQRARGRSPVT